MLFRPAESSKEIVDFYRRYLISTFKTNRDYYNKELEAQLSVDENIANGPYISMSDSFAKDKSISELVNEGILCKSILKLKNLKPDRKLYKHQTESILKAVTGENIIVTTGTGSGKTECFLIPLLNQLMLEKENGTLDAGIRTLIIYPMNALVNDQMRRLRELFEDYEDMDITFGKFTGETKEKYKTALDEYTKREGFEPKKNELISREQMRNSPPNILITNYAMLEYLLLRPGDNIFFSDETSEKWKNIILDEAHTYSGATGIEVGSLLKRVKAMIGKEKIQFMLTSATLGSKHDDSKITGFAQSLCNTSFRTEAIIRATTLPPEKPQNICQLDFRIYTELAKQIRDNYPHLETIRWLEENNIPIIQGESSEESLEMTLYSLIQHDSFYYKVRDCLINQTKQLKKLSQELETTTDDIADFIAVASNAQIKGDKIFEARYHMFLRGIEGVYVTLFPSNKLFLKKMETYRDNPFDEKTEYKAYEISFCHNCEAIFIVGQTDSCGKLIQTSKFDDEYKPEVYLIEGNFETDDYEDMDDGKNYLLCSKCGQIVRESSLVGHKCNHGKENYNRIIKVKDKGEKLHSCPCCHAINTDRSILRPYFLGNEAATAVIATALYDVLPNTKISNEIVRLDDDFFGTDSSEYVQSKVENLDKQFITFSDNRQAAAFFASYLENTYQNSLMKRLMTLVSTENKDTMINGMSIFNFVAKLEEQMTSNNILDTDIRHKQAWMTVSREIINFKARNSLQNEGILYFDINLEMPKGSKLPLTDDEVNMLVKILLLSFFKDGAFSIPVTLTEAEIALFSFGRKINGYQMDYVKQAYVKSWIPNEGKENKRTKLIQMFIPDYDLENAKKLLRSIWKVLINPQNSILIYDSSLGKFLLNLDKVIVKKVEKLYICDECKAVTPFNLKDKCHSPKCHGKLIPYNFSDIKKNDIYKRLYESLNIKTLIAKEHTAQLGSEKAYEYQNSFKNKNINVLSCSTTFEMGVDVGSLETVFMRNMPPTPANYSQRAGRAGRSLKSAAYALTYCPNNSHDLNFFKNPVAMIKGAITPPSFNVNNEKIVLRHIFASAFSFFWKNFPELYKKNIGEFVENNGITLFRDYLVNQPDDLRIYLLKVVSKELHDIFGINDFKWVDKLFSEDSLNTGVFVIAEEKYKSDLNQLQKAYEINNNLLIEAESGSREYNEISWKNRAVNSSIRTIKETNLISFLSKNNLIPKYGFPVDTVELRSVGQSSFMDSLRLDRDLYQAISEYAPESQVVADGKLITSRYVRRLSEYEWPKYNYKFCDNCKTLNRTLWTETLPDNCKQCGYPLTKSRVSQYIIPRFGFIVDNKEPEPVDTSKPEKTYKGSISYIGDGNKIEVQDYTVCGKKMEIGSSKMDELAVLNTSNFYICTECGYGEIHDGKYDPFVSKKHDKSDGYRCKSDILTPFSLGHEFQTDVVQIKFLSENITESNKAWSILYSLLEGLSKCLNIDRKELSGCLHWYRNQEFGGIGNYDFIIFDNTPGGSGYVRNLKNTTTILKMLDEGMKTVLGCNCGGEAADTACYSCLCNYYNQKQHDLLQRKFAIDFYHSLLNENTKWEVSQVNKVQLSNSDQSYIYKARFNNDGQDQNSMSYMEIWDYLKADTEILNEQSLISNIAKFTSDYVEKPIYNGSIHILEIDKDLYVDLIWRKSKVALFLTENYETSKEAQNTDWRVFCLAENFNIDEFLHAISGES